MSIRLLGVVVFLSVVATFSPAAATEQETPPAAPETAEAEEPERVSPQIILETQKPPKYPPAAFAARYTGTVALEVQVLTDDKVGEVKVLHCTRPKMGFEEAAVAAVKARCTGRISMALSPFFLTTTAVIAGCMRSTPGPALSTTFMCAPI